MKYLISFISYIDQVITLSFKIAYHRCRRYYFKLRNWLRENPFWHSIVLVWWFELAILLMIIIYELYRII